jgi:hypothetical protein
MFGTSLQERNDPPEETREVFRKIDVPQLVMARTMLAFWRDRPADGIRVGRDVPSHRCAELLSHFMIWRPTDDRRDFCVEYMGEALRPRFGGYVRKQKMSKLLSPDSFAYFYAAHNVLLKTDGVDLYDCMLIRDGIVHLHYERVTFAATASAGDEKWIVAGSFYY